MNRSLWLGLHIAAGFVALFMAPAAMLTHKGGKAHRRWGQVYFWAMAVVAVTATVLVLAFGASFFLFLIAVFSFYLALTGYRVLFRKKPQQGDKPALLDWAACLVALAGGVALIGWGIKLQAGGPLPGQSSAFGPISIAFGVLSLLLTNSELRSFLRPPEDKHHWWFHHMRGMLTAYIATVTAFSAVNFRFLPVGVRWLWPTVIGTTGLIVWRRHYRLRFAARGA
jgi:hypothetical protein